MATFTVPCPCGCSKSCTAVDAGFSATTITITDPCFGVEVVDFKSAYAEETVTVSMHRDGLVAF